MARRCLASLELEDPNGRQPRWDQVKKGHVVEPGVRHF
jgi:hypothetical protein